MICCKAISLNIRQRGGTWACIESLACSFQSRTTKSNRRNYNNASCVIGSRLILAIYIITILIPINHCSCCEMTPSMIRHIPPQHTLMRCDMPTWERSPRCHDAVNTSLSPVIGTGRVCTRRWYYDCSGYFVKLL